MSTSATTPTHKQNWLDDAYNLTILFLVMLSWPFSGLWKALTKHPDTRDMREWLVILSLATIVVYCFFGWALHARLAWWWLLGAVGCWFVLSFVRGLLQLSCGPDD